jgi:hypothetical protein
MTAPKEHWQINAAKLAEEIREAARKSQTEEDLKMAVEPLLQKAFRQLGVDIDIVQYEKTATRFKGKADAVYGYITIEYKVPGRLAAKGSATKVAEQLERYLFEQAKSLGRQAEDFLEKAVGVAIDGEAVLFVRFAKVPTMLPTPIPIEEEKGILIPEIEVERGFQRLGPYPVSQASIGNLLIFIRAAARRPLTAKDLASVFAPQSDIARQSVSELYSQVVKAQRRSGSSKLKTFFAEWDRIFGVVYGQELEKAEVSAEETAALYHIPAGAKLKPLLFAIHTYYAFLMKAIAIELVALQRDSGIGSFVRDLGSVEDDVFKDKLVRLESGGDFIDRGIVNFLEADFFSWYLDEWDPEIARVFRTIVRALSDFEPATPILEPEWTRDLLQKLYETVVPAKLRHDLGEYYTPDWLAGYVVDRSGFKGEIGDRFLDPACGSGTFLVQAIHGIFKFARRRPRISAKELAEHILKNVVGFDLNPLAVLAARTNYLIAISRLIPAVRPISIPVYLCDSILAPTSSIEEGKLPFENTIVFTTTKGDYVFPVWMREKGQIDKFTSMMDIALRAGIEPGQFEKRIPAEFQAGSEETRLLAAVYRHIKTLDDNGENGIWARYIKNAFAPVYIGQFDFVVGNPPWIRWGYLADDYRKRTLKLWQGYGLFSLTGHAARLGAGEKDFSMLFTYACADNYLKSGGILGFVITIEAFKSKGAGEGFRRFEIKDKKVPLKVLGMEDMVDLKPFQAANKTSIFFLKKGAKTTYPVAVVEWKRKENIGRILPEWSLDEVLAKSARTKLKALPVDEKKITSSWQTSRPVHLSIYGRLKGLNPYKAYIGVRAEPYGVFWLNVKEVRPDGHLVIENMHDRGKRFVKPVSTSIESELVYPAVSGGDITRFGIKSHFYLLIAQNPEKRRGYDEEYLSVKSPLTYAYLIQFKDVLTKRAAYQKYFHRDIIDDRKIVRKVPTAPFYSMYNISEYSFAKYRVVWKRMASRLEAVVISSVKTNFGTKKIISTDTTSLIPVNEREEAHYLCAVLNSDLVDGYIRSFSEAGRGFGAPSIMNNLALPKFNGKKNIHRHLASLSEKAHDIVRAGKPIKDIHEEINATVKALWNIE